MTGMTVLMARTNSGFSYPGSILYLSALYTFYAVAVSIVDLVKFRRLGSPILFAAKVLNLISAMMSVLGLQTSMISRFSENGECYRQIMNAITGGAVYGMVLISPPPCCGAAANFKRRWLSLNKSESKYFATAARMDEAFLALLDKKDFAYITVKEICEAAGVNRSTFYLHYETLADLLAESAQYIIDRFVQAMPQDTAAFLEQLPTRPLEELYLVTPEYLTPYLTYIREHRRVFRVAVEQAAVLRMQAAYHGLNQHVLTPILARFHVPPADREYLMAFYLSGLMAIIDRWLRDDCRDSIEHVIAVMQLCMKRAYP